MNQHNNARNKPESETATQCREPQAIEMIFLPWSAVTRRGLLTWSSVPWPSLW